MFKLPCFTSSRKAPTLTHTCMDLSRIMKVRQFQKLALLSEADGHLQQKLKQLLKLSKEKWDSACEHGKTAVQARGVAKRCQALNLEFC